AANMFNTLGSSVKPAIGAITKSIPTSEKKSGNGIAIVAGIVFVGIIGYELYLHFKRKRKEVVSK
ncbi:MAG: hypothetical protein RL432_945, partial [Bacteroidota bacterium]